jgi:hypothetical protein
MINLCGKTKTQMQDRKKIGDLIRRLLRVVGILMFLPFAVWLLVGWIPGIPSIIDVFGVTGLKIPAGIAIGGLLIAAIGFEDF